MKKVWLIAGEASGDLYGADLCRTLRMLAPDLMLQGMGGVQMKQAGVEIFVDSTELGVVGLIGLKTIRFFLNLLKQVAARAASERPDLVVLIDYPGFNLRLAEKLHKLNIPVVYYISPQVWAWKKGRIHKIAKCVNRLLCIFPFEPKVYDGTGLDVRFVGHPLLEILKPYRQQQVTRDDSLFLLLPGSRSGELKRHIPPFVQTAEALLKSHPELHFAMPLPREQNRLQAQDILAGMTLSEGIKERLSISVGNTRDLMLKASAGLAASGTVTVEAAILGLPLVVAYKANWLSYCVGKMLVKLPWLTIANLVTGKPVYQEFIQHDATPEKMTPAIEGILAGGSRRQEVVEGIHECVQLLGDEAPVSMTVAQNILEILEAQKPGEGA